MDQDIEKLLSLFIQLKRSFVQSEEHKGSFENKITTFLQSHVLFFLEKKPEATLSEIAEYACASSSSTTQLIERLSKAGLVSREVDKKDRRIMRHVLTKKGLTKIAQIKTEKQSQAKKIFSKLNEKDLKTLVTIIEKLVDNVEKKA